MRETQMPLASVMAQELKSAIDAWRKADEQARSAEARLAESFNAYMAGKGPAVEQDLVTEVARTRSVANDRLTTAMSLMKPCSTAH